MFDAPNWLMSRLFPCACLQCSSMIDDRSSGLCAVCWARITWHGSPHCACCGIPSAWDSPLPVWPLEQERMASLPTPEGWVCRRCQQDPPPYHAARSVFDLDEATRPLIHGLKYQDQWRGFPAYGRWMARVGGSMLRASTCMIPVPMTRWRFWLRRYNQATLLARSTLQAYQAIDPSAAGRLHVRPRLLRRRTHHVSQTALDANARHEQLRGAFYVPPASQEQLVGAHILLIDDVRTTEATIRHCSTVLRHYGAASVRVLTLAARPKQPRDQHPNGSSGSGRGRSSTGTGMGSSHYV